MRDAQVVVDELTIAHLDDEWALPCEFLAHEGPDPAKWVMYPTCCTVGGGPYILGCDACKARNTDQHHAIRCEECGNTYAPASLAWRLIEPLERRQ